MTQTLIKIFLIPPFLIYLFGCATVIRGTTEIFHVSSMPEGAIVRLSIGRTCVTPCAIDIPRKDGFTFTIEKQGYETEAMYVKSVHSSKGSAGLLGNIVVGGLPGVGADSTSGALKKLKPNPIQIKLRKIE